METKPTFRNSLSVPSSRVNGRAVQDAFFFNYLKPANGTDSLSRHVVNPLKPTGCVMHQQFNIQQLYEYVLPTLYLSENKQRLVPITL
jgi:hypothetical protein